MPNYAFRATDRDGNTIDGTIAADSEALAANQIGQMGYSLVGLQAAAGSEPTPEALIASASVGLTPPAAAPVAQGAPAPSRLGGIDLTQPMLAVTVATGPPDLAYAADKTTEMPPSGPLQPWERGGPVARAPAPQMTMSATGSVLGRTQPMASMNPQTAVADAVPPSVYNPTGRAEAPRGRERSPYGAGAPEKQKPLSRRFLEIIVYPIFSGVVIKDLAPFYRQFATLIGAGLPIYQALIALEGNTTNAKLKEVAKAGQLQVQTGGKFSDVLAAWPWVFKPVEVELIRAAEQGGMLEQVLKQIADYVEHDWEIKRLVSRETMYPKIVLFVALMILGLPFFLHPPDMALVKLVLGEMKNAGGAGYTGWSYLCDTVGFGLFCLALFFVPYAIFRLFLYNMKGVREGYDAVKNAVPGFGSLAKMFAVARFGRTLAALYRGGFGMSHALEIAGDAAGNAVLRDAVQKAIPAAERGMLVSDSLRSSGFFTPMAIDMFRTGETAGRLDEMLDKMADFYEAEGKLKTRQAALILGTAVFLIVAILVAVAVISFWTGYGSGISSGGSDGQ